MKNELNLLSRFLSSGSFLCATNFLCLASLSARRKEEENYATMHVVVWPKCYIIVSSCSAAGDQVNVGFLLPIAREAGAKKPPQPRQLQLDPREARVSIRLAALLFSLSSSSLRPTSKPLPSVARKRERNSHAICGSESKSEQHKCKLTCT